MKRRTWQLQCVLLLTSGAAQAASILVINDGVAGNAGVVSAVSQLTAVGHSVTTGGTLGDYSSYDQVWDLRYNANLTASDIAAFGAYLASGGRLLLIGENPTFDALRNLGLQALLTAVGAGTVAYGSTVASNSQAFTAAGASVNAPNLLNGVAFVGARGVTSAGNGFLVTEGPPGSGSIVAWDFGQIAGAPLARMIGLWDIDVFRATTGNGAIFTGNLAAFLGAESPAAAVPEPSTLALLLAGAGVVAWRRHALRTRPRERF